MLENNTKKKLTAHLFICTRCINTDISHPDTYVDEIKSELKALCKKELSERSIRINSSGCLGVCDEGIHAVCYPQGKWFQKLSKESIPILFNYIKSTT